MAAILAAPAQPRLITFGRIVYEVRRVNSDDLARVGYATLEGTASVKQAESELKKLRREARRTLKAMSAEQRAIEEARIKEQEEKLNYRRIDAMTDSPQSQVAMNERYSAYICACITGAGRLRDGVDIVAPEGAVDEDGAPVKAGLCNVVEANRAADVLEDLRSEEEIEAGVKPVYVEKIRFVQTEAEQDIDAGRVWVHALTESDRSTLGTALFVLQSVSREVLPFRLVPRPAVAAGPDLEVLQPPATRDAAAGPVADGAGGSVRKRSSGARSRRSTS